ncbi:hypothetical protein F0562_025426 [Nyssa sinensis]|uniref:Uncharacterized protein n=1 Tax=Nyssa sinensis TaxID=561372 RepID=A0A5J5BE89_9ASTE|nr:hypothetical protein F0562_025426 [Nyssa sinensis]
MQGDALATNYANRQAFRSSDSAAGVHSVEGSFGDGAPITYSASAICTRAADSDFLTDIHPAAALYHEGNPLLIQFASTSNTNGLEPTVQSTLGLRDLLNAFSDAVRPVANQFGEDTPQTFVISTIPSGTPQVSSAINQSSIPPVQPKTPVQSNTPVHQPESSTKDTEQQKNSYEIQPIKSMEIGATSNDPLLDNTDSTTAVASQPESSTKDTEQQKNSYEIQPIKSMEIELHWPSYGHDF